jgi:TonB family protein
VTRNSGLISVLLLATIALGTAGGQANPPSSTETVTLAKLVDASYPPLARQARITGVVELEVSVAPDGSADSIRVISGHPMLAKAAEEIARKSKFACPNCSQAAMHHVSFSFELFKGECCGNPIAGVQNPSAPTEEVAEDASGTHVTLRAMPGCICDSAMDIEKVRGWKCLFLWKCERRYPL